MCVCVCMLLGRSRSFKDVWVLIRVYLIQNNINIKQTLINNRFPNYIVDTEIKQFINKPEQPNIDNNLNHK